MLRREGSNTATRAAIRISRCCLALALVACSRSLPTIAGAPSAPVVPGRPWNPPAGVVPPEGRPPTSQVVLPAELAVRPDSLTFADVVDLALRNNPQTRQSWAQARVAAAAYGVARGANYPTVDAIADIAETQSSTLVQITKRSQFAPTLELSYLLLDFGGRRATIAAARANAISFDLTHNAELQTTLLQAESAYFTYMQARALVAAQILSVDDAKTNLEAAQQRHRVGVATIADVLLAQTTLSQAQLDLETDSGAVLTARGALATAMGLRADLPFELAPAPECDSTAVGVAAASVDTLITRALALRPDMAAARTDILNSQAQVRIARSASLPSLAFNGTGGHTYSNVGIFQGPQYALTLTLSVPIFNGFAYQYNVTSAQAGVDASLAAANLLRTQIANQVFSSYYALRTATQRVRTSDVLLTNAAQAERVARGRYRAGVGSILDLLAAQSALATARAQQVQSRWTWLTALAQLSHDVGVLGYRGELPIEIVTDSTGKRR
jgi:outer membrane protein TolC